MKQAGFFEGTELEFRKDILEILKKEDQELKDFAKIQNILVEDISEYWQLSIKIKDTQSEIDELMKSQVDTAKELNSTQLSGIERYLNKVLKFAGLPEFAIPSLLSSLDFPKLVTQFSELQKSIPSLNLAAISPKGLLPNIPQTSPLDAITNILGKIQGSTTTSSTEIDSLVKNINVSGGMFDDTFTNQVTNILLQIMGQLGINPK